LVTLVALTSIAVMVATFPTPGAIKREVAIQVLITIVVMTPITCFGLYAARAGIIMLQAQSDRIKEIGHRLIRRTGKGNAAKTAADGGIGSINGEDNEDAHVDMLTTHDDNNNDDGSMLAMSPTTKLREYLLHHDHSSS
jgi:hypothetical protein